MLRLQDFVLELEEQLLTQKALTRKLLRLLRRQKKAAVS